MTPLQRILTTLEGCRLYIAANPISLELFLEEGARLGGLPYPQGIMGNGNAMGTGVSRGAC